MIVKIIRGMDSTLHDCKKARIIPRTGNPEGSMTIVSVVIDNGDETNVEEVDCVHENAIYFMSDSGQTVDSMRW